MLISKPCPNCLRDHGYSPWRVANSSAYMPLRCHQCGQNFHQKEPDFLLLLLMFAPGSLLWASMVLGLGLLFPAASLPVLITAGSALAIAALLPLFCFYVNRRCPLLPGPRYG